MIKNSLIVASILAVSKVCVLLYLIYMYRRNTTELLAIIFISSLNMTCYIHTLIGDPGYVKPRLYGEYSIESIKLTDGKKIVIKPMTDKREVTEEYRDIDTTLYENVKIENNKIVWFQKFCLDCNSFRTPGTAHCHDCGYCILDKDHHCFALNTCIGRNNLKAFMYLILTDLILTTLFVYKLNKNVLGVEIKNDVKFINLFCFLITRTLILIPLAQVFLVIKFYYLSIVNLRARAWHLDTKRGTLSFLSCIKRLLTFRTPVYSIN